MGHTDRQFGSGDVEGRVDVEHTDRQFGSGDVEWRVDISYNSVTLCLCVCVRACALAM